MRKSRVYSLLFSVNTFYTGCTLKLKQRMYQHQEGACEGYTKKTPCTIGLV